MARARGHHHFAAIKARVTFAACLISSATSARTPTWSPLSTQPRRWFALLPRFAGGYRTPRTGICAPSSPRNHMGGVVAVEMLGVRDIDINQLTFFPGNARRGQLDEIRKSVRRLGQYRSVVVRVINEPPALVVLAGNHTVQAMRAEGHQTAHCGLIRCTDDEARRVNLGDNKLSDIATDDPDALAELLSYLDEDYEGTGWTPEDVGKLIDPPDFGAVPEDEQPRLDEKSPVTCPACGVEFVPQ